MESYWIVISAFAAILGLLAMRIPIGLALIAVSFAGIAIETNIRAAIGSISRLPFELATNWSFSAVPMFLLMGFVASETGLTNGLFRASRKLFRRVPGNLACASVVASALFAAASGSSVATASAMSRIAIPEMITRGFAPSLATGSIAASGTLGSLIPPSILMILFGVYADASIGALFLAGVLPGLLSVAIYLAMIIVRCTLNPELAGSHQRDVEPIDGRRLLADILPLPLLIAIVMGSISFGFATPTEAGALGAAGAILLAIIDGKFKLSKFYIALQQSALTFASIFIIVVGGALLTRFVAVSGLSSEITEFFGGGTLTPFQLILIATVMFIILGMFIDSIGLLLLTMPIIIPIANSMDMNVIWLGIILIKLLEIGLITPPVGLNIFVIQSSLNGTVATSTIFKGVIWFIAMDVVTLIVLFLFPQISLWLPSVLSGG